MHRGRYLHVSWKTIRVSSALSLGGEPRPSRRGIRLLSISARPQSRLQSLPAESSSLGGATQPAASHLTSISLHTVRWKKASPECTPAYDVEKMSCRLSILIVLTGLI